MLENRCESSQNRIFRARKCDFERFFCGTDTALEIRNHYPKMCPEENEVKSSQNRIFRVPKCDFVRFLCGTEHFKT